MKVNQRFNIKSKLALLIFSFIIMFAFIIYALIIPLVEKEKRLERQNTLRAVVESATSIMKYYENGIRTYQWKNDPEFPKTREEAKKHVLKSLRNIRYGEDEHIFILDGKGTMVMHPLKPDLEGTNMKGVKSHDGSFPFQKITLETLHKKEFFVEYSWLSKWSKSVYEPQTTYAKYFYQWDWIVCSSLYTQDIDDAIEDISFKTALYISIGSLIGLIVLYIITLFIINPVILLAKQIRKVKDYTSDTITVESNDEIGDLANAFKHTLDNLKISTLQEKDSEKRQQDLLNNTSSLIYIKDIKGRYTFINKQYEKIHKLTNSEIQGKTTFEVFPKEKASVFYQNELRVIKSKGIIEVEEVIPHDDGDHTYISVMFPLLNSADEIYATCGVLTDITQRKKDEEELKKLKKYLTNTLDSMPSIIIGIDLQNNIIQWNDKAQTVTGILAKDAIGNDLSTVYPRLSLKKELMDMAIQSEKKQTIFKREYKDNDKTFYEDITIFPVISNEDKSIVIRVDDVTEKVLVDQIQKEKLENLVKFRTKELSASNKELQTTIRDLKEAQNKLVDAEKMASLGSLVAGVAHEINTPVGISLTGITYFLDITKNIKELYEKEDMSQEEFETYLKTSNELAQLININLSKTAQLIKSFKQVAVDQTSENKRVFNVKSYIEEVLFSIYNIVKKTKIKIDIKCDEKMEIDSYPGDLSQIITNLLTNSLRHAYEKDDKGTIKIEVTKKDKQIEIIYTDDGKGIPEENISKIFDPFFTTNREKGGTGLGLNIIYNIVTGKLNGTLTCKSKVDQGTQFIVTFPLESAIIN